MTKRDENQAMIAKLVKGINIAMFTTVGPNGFLVSRPLSTQCAELDGDSIWFFTDATSPKIAEIRRNAKVNLAYASNSRNTYVSLAGTAKIVRRQALIDRFWNDALKAFFPKGKDDPNLVLIEVGLRTAEYWDGPGTMIGKAITFAVAFVTGNVDVLAENRIVDMTTGRSRKAPSSDSVVKRAAAKRKASAPLKKVTAKKTTSKRVSAKTSAAGKSSSKKLAARKTTGKRPSTKRATTKKATAKRS